MLEHIGGQVNIFIVCVGVPPGMTRGGKHIFGGRGHWSTPNPFRFLCVLGLLFSLGAATAGPRVLAAMSPRWLRWL